MAIARIESEASRARARAKSAKSSRPTPEPVDDPSRDKDDPYTKRVYSGDRIHDPEFIERVEARLAELLTGFASMGEPPEERRPSPVARRVKMILPGYIELDGHAFRLPTTGKSKPRSGTAFYPTVYALRGNDEGMVRQSEQEWASRHAPFS